MLKRVTAISFIFLCTSIAWAVLGVTIFARTYDSNSLLKGRVASTWGAPQEQCPPGAEYSEPVTKTTVVTEDGKKIERTITELVHTSLPLEAGRIRVHLNLDHRQKGLLWYSTYQVAFSGAYTFRNPTDKERLVRFELRFPAEKTIYDDLVFTVDDVPLAIVNQNNSAVGTARIAPGKAALLRVSYTSQGLDSWRYSFGDQVAQVRDFQLQMTTNFRSIDFPENTLSPTEKKPTPAGWELAWRYKNLLSGYQIGIAMPQKLQPGPLAGRISYFAPVSLFFFFFLLFLITLLRGIELHPMNYFFLAGAFFSFHLLLAYLVDHLSRSCCTTPYKALK
jgi:hypothetical protein